MVLQCVCVWSYWYGKKAHNLRSQRFFFFFIRATVKEKQYRTAENIDFAWVFSLFTFTYIQVVEEQDMYTELKLYRERNYSRRLAKTLPTNNEIQWVENKQRHNLCSLNLHFCTQLCSLGETISCPEADTSLLPLDGKETKSQGIKQLYEIKHILQPFINEPRLNPDNTRSRNQVLYNNKPKLL